MIEEIEPAGFAYPRRLLTRLANRIRFVPLAQVDWIQAANNYDRLHTRDGIHLVRATLEEAERRLDPSAFVRIHRSTIVRLERVREIKPWHGGDYMALMHDGRILRIGRCYRVEMLKSWR